MRSVEVRLPLRGDFRRPVPDRRAAEEHRIGRQERDERLEVALGHGLGERLFGGGDLFDRRGGGRPGRAHPIRTQSSLAAAAAAVLAGTMGVRCAGAGAEQAHEGDRREHRFAMNHTSDLCAKLQGAIVHRAAPVVNPRGPGARRAGIEHDAEGPDDMPAHVRSLIVGHELTVPIDRGHAAGHACRKHGVQYGDLQPPGHDRI